MTPTISRMIHVSYPADPAIPCRAAIVTGIDYAPTPTIYATVFSRDGKMSGVVIDALSPTWHDPRDCAEITTGITSYTPVPAEHG